MCIPQNDEQEPWTWCVIANVVDEHEVGVDHHIEHGTKIFSPGTKVYVSTEWRTSLKDDGGTLFVIGKARKQWRMVGMFIPRNRLTNFRVGRVFDPRVLRRMPTNQSLRGLNTSVKMDFRCQKLGLKMIRIR